MSAHSRCACAALIRLSAGCAPNVKWEKELELGAQRGDLQAGFDEGAQRLRMAPRREARRVALGNEEQRTHGVHIPQRRRPRRQLRLAARLASDLSALRRLDGHCDASESPTTAGLCYCAVQCQILCRQ